ncbi:GrpB family protein [Halalkalibacter sp. AB-rgal2]|uniref:GrpB family protein n=1 Tax=Halalkalibacter sp. AB-rgal2 TaxID=3242695 RepID=UPI00359D9CB7
MASIKGGLPLRKTRIDPWKDEWEESYRNEKEKLKEVFKEELVDIFHIGSTSIPAIGFAKPIIDMLLACLHAKTLHRNDFRLWLL